MSNSEIDQIIEEEKNDNSEPQAETIGNFAEIFGSKNSSPKDGAIPIRN